MRPAVGAPGTALASFNAPSAMQLGVDSVVLGDVGPRVNAPKGMRGARVSCLDYFTCILVLL
jgi:hypothetical protein